MRPYLIYFFALLGLAACGTKEPVQEAATTQEAPHKHAPNLVSLTPEEAQLGGVELGAIAKRTLNGGLKVNGILDVPPEQMIAITAPLGGIVEKTTLLQGQHVKKGDVLATISNPAFIQLQQDYLETKGKLAYAKAELDRQKGLVNDDVAPVKSLQRVQADFVMLEAQAAGQVARLHVAGLPVGAVPFATVATLRAPKDAYVRDVNITTGQTVLPTDAMYMLVDPSHLHVELTVFEKDIPALYNGQEIRFTLPSSGGAERKAHIYLIGRTVDASQRTVRVHGHLDKEDFKGLLPGMFVKAVIETSQRHVDVLPNAAVVDYEGKPYVFQAKGGKDFTLVPIVKGEVADGFTEVTIPGMAKLDGVQFVVKGAYSLLSKMKNAAQE